MGQECLWWHGAKVLSYIVTWHVWGRLATFAVSAIWVPVRGFALPLSLPSLRVPVRVGVSYGHGLISCFGCGNVRMLATDPMRLQSEKQLTTYEKWAVIRNAAEQVLQVSRTQSEHVSHQPELALV